MMAKITTRKATPSADIQEVLERLQAIMATGSGGAVSNQPNALLSPGNDIDETLDTLEDMFEKINEVGRRMVSDIMVLSADNLVMSVKLAEALDLLDKFCDVSYDEALDHATADLMDALISSGAGEATDDGDITFDPRVTMGRSDLKPVLREAINRWVELKLQ